MRDLTLAIPEGFGKRKTKILESSTNFNLFLLVLILVLGVGYLTMINSLSTKGYEIRKLKQQITAESVEQKDLQIEASDLQSITRIQALADQSSFVPSANVTYLKNSDFALK